VSPGGQHGQRRDQDEREALLATAERTAQLGTWTWDLVSNEVAWSPELYRILGCDPATVSASTEAFFATVHPEDVKRVRAVSAASVATGQPVPVECRMVRASGEVRDALVDSVGILDAEGRLVRFVGTILDVTERRAAERRLRRSEALLNEAQQLAGMGSYTWSPADNVIEWSSGLFRILGVDPSISPSPELFASLLHKDDRARFVMAAEQAIAAGAPRTDDFRIVRHSDGAVRHIHMVSNPVRDESGKCTSYVGTMLDTTERSQLEEQLRQAQKMEAIGRLAGGVAHDFNNLLTIMMVNAQIFTNNEGPREEIQQIAAAAAHAAELTRRLLLFSRSATVDPVVLDVNDVLEGAVKLFSRVIGEDVEVKLDLARGIGKIRADSSHLHQVLLNLVVNARDAMPKGGTLLIRTSPAGGRGERVLIEVRDTGVGMDEHTRSRIFEPFFTTKAAGKGTGLGLSTVFGIVRQSGGAIEVTSQLGEGTTFKLYFPAIEDAPASDASPRPEVLSALNDETILIVEDNPEVSLLMARMLRRAGYIVHTAGRPSEAIHFFREHAGEIALVVADVIMPEGSGPELVRRLRMGRRQPRVLYVTGYDLSSEIETSPSASASPRLAPLDGPTLTKPFTQEVFLAKVREVLSAEPEAPRDRSPTLGAPR
jgi:two-component system, cell cycle sensor histidine kinase and response regulator CckA